MEFRHVRTKALFRDRKTHFIVVLLDLYVNRIYSILYCSLHQSSLASLVLSGCMALLDTPISLHWGC